MKNILVVFGTRPELIKLAPLVTELKKSKFLRPFVCSTGQHRELLTQTLQCFDLEPDFSLGIMEPNQDLFTLNQNLMKNMRQVIEKSKPDLVVVQGDTTTAFATALCAFYLKVPVAHVEAGLRTFDKYSPFPEEMNRVLISKIAEFHFAPTELASRHLQREGVDPRMIHLVGNTGVDALLQTASKTEKPPKIATDLPKKKWFLMTVHRRENFGEPLKRIFSATRQFLEDNPSYHAIYPVHPNPQVKDVALKYFSEIPSVSLIEPLGFGDLVWILKRVAFVMTDSGGLQEECPTFGKPVLVLRESTERTEAIDAGCAQLVGTDPLFIQKTLRDLTKENSLTYVKMAQAKNPFGDGTASLKITSVLEKCLKENSRAAA